MFTKQQTVEQKFTQFLDERQNWQTDRELQREMRKLMQQYPDRNEEFFFGHFLRQVREQQCLRSRRHLSAYSESTCYSCTRAVARKFNVISDWGEYFQDLREQVADVGKFWRRYELDRSHPLSYAYRKLDRYLTEKIFRDRQDRATSGYGWLSRIPEKQLRKALENLSKPKQEQYILVWSKFKAIPDLPRVRKVIQSPTPAQFTEIAQQCSNSGYAIDPNQVEEILKDCIADLNATRPQTDISIDARSWKEDDLESQKIEEDLLFESDIAEIFGNTPEQSRIISVLLGGSIAYLDSPIQKLSKKIAPGTIRKSLFLQYGLGVKQSVIGEIIGMPQYEVSRQTTRIKICLIQELVALAKKPNSQINLNTEYLLKWEEKLKSKDKLKDKLKQDAQINIDADDIDELGYTIDELLTWYYRQEIHKELEHGLRSHPQISLEINTLAIYFGELRHDWTQKLLLTDWTPAELDKWLKKAQEGLSKKLSIAAEKLQLTEEQLQEKVNSLIAEFIEYISTHFRNKFSLDVEIISTIKECLERVIYAFLHNAPYQLLAIN